MIDATATDAADDAADADASAAAAAAANADAGLHALRAVEAVVFDLDDTLFPEKDYVFSGFDAVGAWLDNGDGDGRGDDGGGGGGGAGDGDGDGGDAGEGKVGADADAIGLLRRKLTGAQFAALCKDVFNAGRRGDIFNAAAARVGAALPAGAVARIVGTYREHTPTLTPDAGALGVLRTLRAHGLKTGIITDGWLAVQRRKVAALGLAALVDAVVFSDQWGREAWKPAARPFREMETLLGMGEAREKGPGKTPGKCLYIGDNPAKDFLGARRAGWLGMRLRIAGREHSEAEPATPEAAPDFEVANWAALAAMG